MVIVTLTLITFILIFIYMFVCIVVFVRVYIYIYICTFLCVRTHAGVHVCIYVCTLKAQKLETQQPQSLRSNVKGLPALIVLHPVCNFLRVYGSGQDSKTILAYVTRTYWPARFRADAARTPKSPLKAPGSESNAKTWTAWGEENEVTYWHCELWL